MRLVPMPLTAVLVRSTDSPAIRDEMSEIAGEKLALALTPEQVKAILDEFRSLRRDLILHDDAGRE